MSTPFYITGNRWDGYGLVQIPPDDEDVTCWLTGATYDDYLEVERKHWGWQMRLDELKQASEKVREQ